MSAQLSTVGGRGGGELGVLYQGRQGSVSAHLSTGMGGGGGRSEWVSEVLYQGRQRSVSAHLSTVWGRVGGVQSSVLRQTEVSVSLPLYSCEGEVRSV